MNNFLDREFLNNTIREYLWVIAVIFFVWALSRFISKYIAIILCKIFKRQWKTFDQQKFIELIIHPLGVFLVITVSIVALYRLSFPPEFNILIYKYPIRNVLLSVGITIQIIAFIWLLLRLIDFIAIVLKTKTSETN